MNCIAAAWTWFVEQIHGLRVQLRLCLRMTVAAVLAFSLSQLLHLPLPLWAVLTAVIVTQVSVGKSLKVTLDYMEGTLGGAIYSGAVGTFVPHALGIGIVATLAIAIAPLALLAATSQRFTTAPFTAVMVLLMPTITHVSAIHSAFFRVLEVGVGCAVALSVSFLVLPERAHSLVIEAAAQMLALMAQVLPRLVAALGETQDAAEIARIQGDIGRAYLQLIATAAEAKRERVAYFNADPDTQPLVDTLLRLRHDLIMVGRAALQPLPPRVLVRLGGEITETGKIAADYLRAASAALAARQPPPPLSAVEAAFDACAAAFAAARHEGLMRDLSADAVERIFAFGFALEQLHRDFGDLERGVRELARASALKSQA